VILVRIVDSHDDEQACFDIRRHVFIEEQSVPTVLEFDGLDATCTHFLATDDGGPVGTARLHITGDGEVKAERVAVLPGHRTGGVGRALMDALEKEAARRGHVTIGLGAQVTAIGFYEKLGYAVYGPEFDDAGIPHRMMRKRI